MNGGRRSRGVKQLSCLISCSCGLGDRIEEGDNFVSRHGGGHQLGGQEQKLECSTKPEHRHLQ